MLSVRFTIIASLASLCLAAVGCAVPTTDDPAGPANEDTESTQQDLTAAQKALAGTFYTQTFTFGGFGTLKLQKNGHFTAQVDPAGTAVCITSPCLLPESGTWTAKKNAGGGYRLTIKPTGLAARTYNAVRTASELKLTGIGAAQTLYALGQNACLDDADCSATEECAPRYCFMICEVNDPLCCGPSVCQPKTPPPPPPSCQGAWLDQFGSCRTPADGVYPDSCCATLTTPCGPSACGVGEVCCNPLAGICTKPGEFCAQ